MAILHLLKVENCSVNQTAELPENARLPAERMKSGHHDKAVGGILLKERAGLNAVTGTRETLPGMMIPGEVLGGRRKIEEEMTSGPRKIYRESTAGERIIMAEEAYEWQVTASGLDVEVDGPIVLYDKYFQFLSGHHFSKNPIFDSKLAMPTSIQSESNLTPLVGFYNVHFKLQSNGLEPNLQLGANTLH